jgi:hypothetical protein
MPEEMLVFYARLPEQEIAIDLRSPSAQELAEAAFTALEASRQAALEYSPVDLQAVRKLAGSGSLSIAQLSAQLSQLKQSALEQSLLPLVKAAPASDAIANPLAKTPKGEPVEFAVSAYLGALFDRAMPPEPLSWQKPGKEKREVRLVANARGWQSVKKVEFAGSERKEVCAASATIFERVKSKLPDLLLGEKAEEFQSLLDAFVAKYPERKSFGRLPEILSAAEKEFPKLEAIAGGDKRLESRLRKLFLYACFARAGFTPYPSSETVGRVWPELKIPKPRGNFGGKKKKKA